MADLPVLTYFNGRGRAEAIRMVLCAGGIKYREVDLTTKEEFRKLKADGKLMFSCVPLLEVDGQCLVETGPLIRYAARLGGLGGQSPIDSVRIDSLFEGTRETNLPLMAMGFGHFGTIPETKEKLTTSLLPKFLPIYDQVLRENNTGFLVCSSLSVADLGLFEVLMATEDYLDGFDFSSYPQIKKFLGMMKAHPKLQYYLSDIRKPMNTEQNYIAVVMAVLKKD